MKAPEWYPSCHTPEQSTYSLEHLRNNHGHEDFISPGGRKTYHGLTGKSRQGQCAGGCRHSGNGGAYRTRSGAPVPAISCGQKLSGDEDLPPEWTTLSESPCQPNYRSVGSDVDHVAVMRIVGTEGAVANRCREGIIKIIANRRGGIPHEIRSNAEATNCSCAGNKDDGNLRCERHKADSGQCPRSRLNFVFGRVSWDTA